jgi:hypothetical protein
MSEAGCRFSWCKHRYTKTKLTEGTDSHDVAVVKFSNKLHQEKRREEKRREEKRREEKRREEKRREEKRREEKRREEGKSIHMVPQLHGAPFAGDLCIAR